MNEMISPPTTFRRKHVEPEPDLPRGNLFKRMLVAKAVALLTRSSLEDAAAEMWPRDRELAALIKAATNPAETTTAGWARELAQVVTADIIEALGPASGAAEVLSECLLLNWDGAGGINVPGFVASGANAGFVTEGNPIPVGQLTSAGVLLSPHTMFSIAVLTREMIESSNAEALIGDTLIKSAGMALDIALFGATGPSSAAPAGLRYNIAASAPSASVDPFGGFFEDMSTLIGEVGTVGGSGPFYLVGSAGRIVSARQRFVTEAEDIHPVISAAVGADLIAIAPMAIAAALSPTPDMEMVSTGTLVMDTAPGAAGTMGPERSLFQTDSLALKLRWPVSWVLRDPRGVAWLTPAWK